MKNIILISAILCVVAAAAMYLIGNSSSHLSELKDLFWIPLPIGILLFLIFFKQNKPI